MFDSPRPASPVPAALRNYIQPNFGHGLRIWWAFFWPTSLISTILTVALNFIVRRGYENLRISAALAGPLLKYDPYALNYIVALFVMDYSLQKQFRHFRIALLTNQGGEGAQSLDSTMGRALRVWWTYSWRSIVYRFIAIMVTALPRTILIGLFTRLPVLHALATWLLMVAVDGGVGLFVIYSNILDEDFGDFRVSLLPLQGETVSPADPAATPAQM